MSANFVNHFEMLSALQPMLKDYAVQAAQNKCELPPNAKERLRQLLTTFLKNMDSSGPVNMSLADGETVADWLKSSKSPNTMYPDNPPASEPIHMGKSAGKNADSIKSDIAEFASGLHKNTMYQTMEGGAK